MADGEPRVPQQGEGARHQCAHVLVRSLAAEEEEVDVRIRRQLAATVASEGHHRDLVLRGEQRGRAFRGGQAAGPGHHDVHEVAAGGGQVASAAPEPMADAQALGLDLQEAAEPLHAVRLRWRRIDRAVRVRRAGQSFEHDGTDTEQPPCLRACARRWHACGARAGNDLQR